MDDTKIGAALTELADLMVCVSNDFHTLHLNYMGAEFDTMHKKTLQKYYEEAAEDFDSLYEAASMFVDSVPNINGAGDRIKYQAPIKDGLVDKIGAVQGSVALLKLICDYFVQCFSLLNEIVEVRCIGVSNFLQTRIEYWSKEAYYFNFRRIEA